MTEEGDIVGLHQTSPKRSIIAVVTISMVVAVLQFAAAGRAVAATAGSIYLQVQSARPVNSEPGFVHEGDAVTACKWLINKDDDIQELLDISRPAVLLRLKALAEANLIRWVGKTPRDPRAVWELPDAE